MRAKYNAWLELSSKGADKLCLLYPSRPFPRNFAYLIYYAVILINFIPDSKGIYEYFSPREIFRVRALDFNKHCKAQLDSYVESHEDRVVTNTQNPRTFPGIYLVPTGNIQGTLRVFSLKTGVVDKSRTMTDFPMSERFITLVDKWANSSSREYTQSRLEFLNRHKQKFYWENDGLDESEGQVEDAYP